LLCIHSVVISQETTIYGPFNLFEKKVKIQIDSAKTSYALPDSFIIGDSEIIVSGDDTLAAQADYQMNYIEGSITFLMKIKAGITVNAFYRILPLQLQKTYYHRKLVYLPDSVKSQQENITPIMIKKEPSNQSSLRKNGSIVRGISLGSNQGLKVESGLRMNLSGRIADKVDVVAALTDQTTPIQPEGNTQTLNEIDKVFVELRSDFFKATMGDYYLSFSGSEFAQYQRKLQGAMGSVQFDNFDVTLSGAVSKGKYTTNYFLGQEGNQGPYQLTGERGQIDIIVLAGTEQVWIDGELKTRGENNDYIIEYSNGQITFTRHRLITAESRITVDFQYSDLKFQRNLYGVKTQSRLLNDKINLDVRFIHEADDKDNPLDYTLSDENIAILKNAGDNGDSAYVSGINYVGDSAGYYTRVDSAGIQFYQYAGPDSGDYNVSFSYVGSGKGDYKSIGFGNYKYVGAGNGSYLPVIFLELAKRHNVADVGLTINLNKNFYVTNEFAVSQLDLNTYSNDDDEDNTGLAYRSSFKFQPEKAKILGANIGRLTVDGKYRSVNSKFQYIDRTEEIEKDRKWDLGTLTSNEETIQEIHASYQPVDKLDIALGGGKINKGNYFASNRWEARYDMSINHLPRINYNFEWIESENKNIQKSADWLRQSGSTDYQFWKLRPFLSYVGEVKKESLQDTLDSGFKYDEYSSGLELVNLKRMSVSTAVIKREDKTYEQHAFFPLSEALTQKYQWKYVDGGKFSASMEYVHRDKKYSDPEQSNKKANLGDVQIKYSPFKRALITDWHYQLSNTQVAKQERVYLKVPEGEGNFRYNEQTDEYEPYDLGDYILRIRQTDEYIPVVELKASSRLQFKPELLFKKENVTGWRKWLSEITTDTYVRIEEKTEEKDVWAIYRLELSKFQQPGKTIFGNSSFRQDVYIMQNNRDFSLRLRYDQRNEVNYQYLEGGSETKFIEKSFRLTRRFSDVFSSQMEGSQIYKSYFYTNRSDKIIKSNELSLDLSYRPKQVLEFAIKSIFALKKDEALEPATKATEYSLMPRCSFSFRGKGKLRLEYEWTDVSVLPNDRIVPYELVGINRTGNTQRWTIGLNYNISQYVMTTISYNGRQEPGRPDTVHIGRAEMRAYF